MLKVLICGNIVWAHKDVETMISPLAEVLNLSSISRAEFRQDCKPGGKYSEIMGIYRHNSSSSKIGAYDAELVHSLPSGVKWIAHNGSGYDQIDIDACRARGILVSNTPGAVDEGTATTALYLIISALRQFARAEKNLAAGNWKRGLAPAHDLSSRTLGILGFGGIGLRTAELTRGFRMRVVYHSRKRAVNEPEWAEYYADFKGFLQVIDILSIHVPLNAETCGLVGEKEIRTLKKGSVIVNTARGKILDEDALIRALADGHLYAAGLDVYPDEPKINPRLLTFPNVTLLPHMGTETEETQHRMEIRALQNLQDYLKGGKGKDIVPELR